ncbi:hypothetical protein C8A00DRAFT_35100 [Chaetomidium leptoderma]|uniref:Uncharacterized protein n=1 Tax=Chaetomidium leptoderma TaxID=669021 RepID=A0AAN6VK01_9PEZI|nr:hypothetical protein C8A00DRAFT_35100 [Chaetomidium leptoderma]
MQFTTLAATLAAMGGLVMAAIPKVEIGPNDSATTSVAASEGVSVTASVTTSTATKTKLEATIPAIPLITEAPSLEGRGWRANRDAALSRAKDAVSRAKEAAAGGRRKGAEGRKKGEAARDRAEDKARGYARRGWQDDVASAKALASSSRAYGSPVAETGPQSAVPTAAAECPATGSANANSNEDGGEHHAAAPSSSSAAPESYPIPTNGTSHNGTAVPTNGTGHNGTTPAPPVVQVNRADDQPMTMAGVVAVGFAVVAAFFSML